MATTCDAQLEDGSKSRLLYIIPKYDLNAAIKRLDDMFSAMRLCLARSEAAVEAAAADPETGRAISQCFLSDIGSPVVNYDGRDCRWILSVDRVRNLFPFFFLHCKRLFELGNDSFVSSSPAGGYCVLRHLWLRKNFCGVFVTKDNSCRDSHKDWIQNGGHSEHALFIQSLLKKDGALKIREGPSPKGWRNCCGHLLRPPKTNPKKKIGRNRQGGFGNAFARSSTWCNHEATDAFLYW